MKRAAIQLSGHVRHFKQSQGGLNRLLKSFEDYKVDIFGAFWDVYDTNDGPKAVEGKITRATHVKEEEIRSFYNPIDVEINSYDEWRPEFHYTKYIPDKPTGFPAHYYIVNDILICAPQLFCIWRAAEIRKMSEEEGKESYDVVIRARPDFLPTKRFEPKESSKIVFPIVYTEKGRTHALDDRFCYGPSAAMDVFSNIYPNLKHIIQDYDAAKFPYEANEAKCQHLSCERIMHRWLVEKGIEFVESKDIELARMSITAS